MNALMAKVRSEPGKLVPLFLITRAASPNGSGGGRREQFPVYNKPHR